VATAVDSLPEVLGEAGVLVPSEDPRALARALGRLLQEDEIREAMECAARERAARFALEPMLQATARLYREVLAT